MTNLTLTTPADYTGKPTVSLPAQLKIFVQLLLPYIYVSNRCEQAAHIFYIRIYIYTYIHIHFYCYRGHMPRRLVIPVVVIVFFSLLCPALLLKLSTSHIDSPYRLLPILLFSSDEQ